MKLWRSVQCYYKGEVETLDKKWENYKNKRIFVGDAWSEALTKQEVDNLAKIQRKKRIKTRETDIRRSVNLCGALRENH